MAVLKGGGTFSKDIFVVFRCGVLLLAANYHCGTEAILMWNAPPPAWNQTTPGTSLANIQTAVYRVGNGSTNVILRWNYTLLPGQTLLLTTFSIGDGISQDDIGLVIGGPVGTPNNRYKDLYSIYSTSQFSNLTINMVTEEENATFQCKLQVGADVWAYNIRVEVTDPAVITHISENQTVNETNVVALNCSAKGMPTPIHSWTRVSDNSSVSFPLTIASKQDEGGYRCTADNGIGKPASQVVYIIVENYHPIDTNLRTSLAGNSVVVNTSFNITCGAQANPPAKYKFYKDQNNFVNDTTGSDVSVITTSVSERRKQVNYSCIPFNHFGDGLTDGLTLTVLFPPAISYAVPDYQVIEGNGAILFCNATGNPEPNITWTKQGNSSKLSTSETLYLTKVMREDDGSVYKCTVTNEFGSTEATAVVTLLYLPTSINIATLPSNNTILRGDALSLKCTADANPDAHIYHFYLNDAPIGNSSSGVFNTTVMADGVYTCVPENTVGERDNATVSISAVVAPHAELTAQNDSVIEGGNVTLTCNVSGDPSPSILLTDLGSSEVLSDTASHTIVDIRRPGTPDNIIQYQCTASNGVGTPARDIANVTVYYAPDTTTLTTVPSNRTLLRDSFMTLNCRADASPEAEYQFYFNGSLIGNSSSGVFNTTIKANGVYACVPFNTFGRGENATVDVTAVVAPHAELTAQNDSVIEGGNVTLTCNVTGDPSPSILLTDLGSSEVLSDTASHTIVDIRRPGTPDNVIQYQCTASNGVETPARDITNVTVYYAPDTTTLTTVPSNRTLLRDSFMTLNCRADASPEAEYQFYFNGRLIGNSSSGVFNTTVKANGVYTCVPFNPFGRGENATVDVAAVVPESDSILVTLTVTNRGCDDNPSEICEQIREKVEEKIEEDDELKELTSVTVKNCLCGSVTAYLSLDFTQNVKIPDVISVLKEAAEGGGFGDFQVDPGSIRAISKDELPTDSPSSTVGTTTSEDDKDKVKLWIIIGASVGGAIVLAIVVAVVAWCVHHKRKCRRKGSKVRCSESDAFAPEEGNDYGYANNGYADAGPRPSEMGDVSQHQRASGSAAVPIHAVVDKSAKKGSKKDKKVEEEKPQAAPPQYTTVDKSKKKKKEVPEATYAQVDKSKNSKKKPKSGEVLYADLGDFHQMKELPAVSTSPQALPPIKKPTAYGETHYADITQFLKGDATLPESNNSEGPGTGTQAAPAPENSTSQEPGTSTKETSQASNPGGNGGPGHDTNF